MGNIETAYGTHTLDTPERETETMREWLEDRGLKSPSAEAVRSALADTGKDPYLAAIRAGNKARKT